MHIVYYLMIIKENYMINTDNNIYKIQIYNNNKI